MSAYQQMNPAAGEGGYWVGGVESATREDFAKVLNQREGFRSSDELMCQWLENLGPYMIENGYVVIGPLGAIPFK